MIRKIAGLAGVTLFIAALAIGCGGGGDDEGKDDNSNGASSPTAAKSDRTWTFEDAKALLDTLPIMPADLERTWTVSNDVSQNNEEAAKADPTAAPSFERCGRLLSRLVVNMPDDTVQRYISGETVSYFSTFTVYATDDGAADCAIEAAQRFSQCSELAKAFGTIFIDPSAVSCTPFDFQQVANGSFGIGLSGKISAAGTIVDLTIRIVAFRDGNVTGVVGSAAAFEPDIEELKPLVAKVVERIDAAR